MSRIVVANWKMCGNRNFLSQWIADFNENIVNKKIIKNIIICPPTIYFYELQKILFQKDLSISLGLQKISNENNYGAFTGEIAAKMLHDYDGQYAICGHSERRIMYHENDINIALQWLNMQQNHIQPILCIGENENQYENNETLEHLKQQLSIVIDYIIQYNYSKLIVAYEPIWAIGTGKSANPEIIIDVLSNIREYIENKTAKKITCSLLYGGSVNIKNILELAKIKQLDGLLVGSASLKAKEFAEICQKFIG